MSRETIWTFIVGIIYLATIYALVRPSSKGPTIINNIFNALADVIKGSVGYTWDATNNQWKSP